MFTIQVRVMFVDCDYMLGYYVLAKLILCVLNAFNKEQNLYLQTPSQEPKIEIETEREREREKTRMERWNYNLCS